VRINTNIYRNVRRRTNAFLGVLEQIAFGHVGELGHFFLWQELTEIVHLNVKFLHQFFDLTRRNDLHAGTAESERVHRCFSAWLAIQRPFARMVCVQRSIDDPIGSLLTIESGKRRRAEDSVRAYDVSYSSISIIPFSLPVLIYSPMLPARPITRG
jgi:hypothetical protein